MSGLIESIRKDREAGTPGPWRIVDCDSMGDRCTHYFQEVWNDETDVLVTTEVTRAHGDGGRANVRRCARVPNMEAALLAAEELAKAAGYVEGASPVGDYEEPMMAIERETLADILRALAAYREAVK